MNSNTNK